MTSLYRLTRKLGETEGPVQDISNFFEGREKPTEKKVKVQGIVEKIRKNFEMIKKEDVGNVSKLIEKKQQEIGLGGERKSDVKSEIDGDTTKEMLGCNTTRKVELLGMVPRGVGRKLPAEQTLKLKKMIKT